MKTIKTRQRRAGDAEFKWVVPQLGQSMQEWAKLAAEWMGEQSIGVDLRQHALSLFLDRYIVKQSLPHEPSTLLRDSTKWPSFYDTCCPKSFSGVIYNNHVNAFLDWVLAARFSRLSDDGTSILCAGFSNPVKRHLHSRATALTESARTPLPYRFIAELRSIIAPGRSFRDWTWAQGETGKRTADDWFETTRAQVNEEDPDCVWRERVDLEGNAVVEIWSPVRHMLLLAKLLVPLRTYQVRMLDSGEADYWKYSDGIWQVNQGSLASGTADKPTRHGVFRRVIDAELGAERTALYINTNKTADLYRGNTEPGYVVPWQHEELLYWLEKLRNWQERYNPIVGPCSWLELDIGQLGGNAKSKAQLTSLRPTCFLFRNASARDPLDRCKPVPAAELRRPWFLVLQELERRCASRGETLSSGKPLRFVRRGTTTDYPLHSLRVSLLTCLALDGDVPLPILSKLVAGHSRLLMTLYYVKAGPGRVSRVLKEAEQRIAESSDKSLQRFLEDASYEDIAMSTACNSEVGVRLALSGAPNERSPASWIVRSYGVCLSASNTSAVEAKGVTGCHNGGPKLNGDREAGLNGPVPGGPGNCVRCRWFISEPRYLDALRAHFNNVSYHLSETALKAKALEEKLELIRVEKATAEGKGVPFDRMSAYLQLERLWESAISQTDQLANDLIATLRLIHRCLAIAERENDMSGKHELVAVGATADLRMVLQETDSEALQVAEVCADAALYPDEDFGKAVLRRSQLLDSALVREGLPPFLMTFSEEEQLRVGNHLMERLATARLRGQSTSAGVKRIAGALDSGQRLSEILDIEPDDIFCLNEVEAVADALFLLPSTT
ncbi:gamma-mobile-trio integrase GmtZ [Paraburkholderia graminis]|uniref:Integrase n=1 Tax=Paraburkholderia graminis TaxID=60548 RepID=A0ABD5CJN6_9BURK|nr:VPA1269 family protein [Paraburkholderia graminis]MDR6205427.1 hypothetical protein [Paraburkholderia graminis]